MQYELGRGYGLTDFAKQWSLVTFKGGRNPNINEQVIGKKIGIYTQCDVTQK